MYRLFYTAHEDLGSLKCSGCLRPKSIHARDAPWGRGVGVTQTAALSSVPSSEEACAHIMRRNYNSGDLRFLRCVKSEQSGLLTSERENEGLRRKQAAQSGEDCSERYSMIAYWRGCTM